VFSLIIIIIQATPVDRTSFRSSSDVRVRARAVVASQRQGGLSQKKH